MRHNLQGCLLAACLAQIDPEVIMTISTNNPGLEECKLRWEAGKEGLLTQQQWTTYWKRFRNNLVFIQQRKLKLEQ